MTSFEHQLFGHRLTCDRELWGVASAGSDATRAPSLRIETDGTLGPAPHAEGSQSRSYRDDFSGLEGKMTIRHDAPGAYSWYFKTPGFADSRVDFDFDRRTIRMSKAGPYHPFEFVAFLISPVMPYWVRVSSPWLALHATVIAIGDVAIAVAGASGRGKTTLAMAFHRAGHAVLADDLAVIDPESGLVHHGPSFLRVDPATRAKVLGEEMSTSIRHVPSAKDLLDTSDHPFWAAPRALPLAGIFVLEDAAENGESSVSEFPRALAGAILNAHLAGGLYAPPLLARHTGLAAALAVSQRVSVHSLSRPRRLDHLDATVKLVCDTVEERRECQRAVVAH